MTGKDGPRKMVGKKKGDHANQLSARPPNSSDRPPLIGPTQSSSVPSTPQQHARKFSFEDREPSPNAGPNHSPRSAYSETNSTLPSLRLPPRQGGCKYETATFRIRRRMPYSIGDERLEKVEPSKIKSKLSEDDERKLETDMRELYDRLLPTQHMEENRQKLVKKLEKIFNDEWPGHDIKAHLFGSSGNLLCSDDSDVDICITTSWKDLEQVCKIAELLANHGMEKVVCVSSAKVPIVKIWDPELGLACDMNVNNTLALENTRMVRTYVEIDERVRPLAMIIKYWTRRRVVNDAAFGGTLSSYTWICMIIAFLQLQQPLVVPALHQRLNARLPAKDGQQQSSFADDLSKLRNAGKRNKDSIATLLFRFFRFYAHDFDYDKLVLSVRMGKTLTRKEKKWESTVQNMLCVEEPFSITRSLGNTADDYSFKGLHLELRRAFDLISEGKLDECCQQWVWPKEEERIWQRPAPAPRPVLVRSSSQSHSGRGGRGGFRGGGNRQFHRNSNPNRGASSSVAFDNNATAANGFVPGMLPQFPPLDPQQAAMWYQLQNPPQLHQDVLGNTLTALQLQEHNLRFQLFTQTQAFNQQAAFAHAQRMQSGQSTQTGDRARTNSLDTPPLSAPPVQPPEMYMYPYPMQQYYTQPSLSTYPSSPSTTTSNAPEFRRSLHRATVNGQAGLASGAGSLRSQSQPARPSVLPGQVQPDLPSAPPTLPDLSMQRPRGPMPSFIADETIDIDYEEGPSMHNSNSPPEEEDSRFMGYPLSDNASPVRQPVPNQHIIPSFGDLTQGIHDSRRRLSTDQIPQSILDRRMRRASSRSPSPLRHTRAFSAGTNSAPLSSVPFPPAGHKPLSRNRPLVVNGSVAGQGQTVGPSRQSSASESFITDASAFDNPLRINAGVPMLGANDQPIFQTPKSAGPAPLLQTAPLIANGSMIVNGSMPMPPIPVPIPATIPAAIPPSNHVPVPTAEPFRPGPTPGSINGLANGHVPLPQSFAARASAGAATSDRFASTPGASARRLREVSRQQPIGIAPLDLALSNHATTAPLESQHLSPINEARTPSPTVRRKLEISTAFDGLPPIMGSNMVQSANGRVPNGVWASNSNSFAGKAKGTAPVAGQNMPSAVASGYASGQGQGQLFGQQPMTMASNVPRPNGLPPRPPNGMPISVRQERQEDGAGNSAGWQKTKAGKGKKGDGGKAANGSSTGETMPRDGSERKGG